MDTKQPSEEYIRRVNRVLDHIDAHYADSLTLEQMADIAHFSPYHFHRIFRGVVGEPLNRYIQRIRVEKAAGLLQYQPERAIADIALCCGFGSQAAFARVFKSYFEVSATQWRNSDSARFSKKSKTDHNRGENVSNGWQVAAAPSLYIEPSTNRYSWTINMLSRKDIAVEVKTLPAIRVAYIRNIGTFKGEKEKWASLFQKLMHWAAARDLIRCPETRFFTVFRDDLNITDFSKFKADVCLSIEDNIRPEGEIGVSVIPAGKYAVASFDINGDEYEQAWELMFREWLPGSGYQPDERCCFERYLNDPAQHPQNRHFIEVCIPVKPL